MLRALLVLFCVALPAKAEDKKVTITFLGGAKKVPLEGLKVSIRRSTGRTRSRTGRRTRRGWSASR
jgi:hypothetical protein